MTQPPVQIMTLSSYSVTGPRGDGQISDFSTAIFCQSYNTITTAWVSQQIYKPVSSVR